MPLEHKRATQSGVSEPLRERKSHVWVRSEGDWYIEPAWCSERLFEDERFDGEIVDPACGVGTIVGAALRAGHEAVGCDKVSRGFGNFPIHDFMLAEWRCGDRPDNIVSNPPFKLCRIKDGLVSFPKLALQRARRKVALLLPTDWIQGDKRARWLAETPLYRVYFMCPRPSMPPGEAVLAGAKAEGGKQDFAWFVWLQGFEGTATVHWLFRDR